MDIKSLMNRLQEKKTVFFILLFAAAFLFRLPTLFNDYWDVDVLTSFVATKEYLFGAVPGVDFEENKRFLYHLMFKGAFRISADYGWVLVHFFTILIVYFTSIFIYLSGSAIRDKKTGMLSALLYAVLISSFNRHFMASNGEVIYNLPVAAGLFFFILFLKENPGKRLLYIIGALVCSYLAVSIKFQALIFFMFLVLFLLVYIPYYNKRFRFIAVFLPLILLILVFDFFITGLIVRPALDAAHIMNKISYSAADSRGFSMADFFVRFIHRQGMLALWHMILWVPSAVYITAFIRKRFRAGSIAESAVAVFFIISWLVVFAGGARLYFHYFMVSYIAGSVIASIVILDIQPPSLEWIRKRAVLLIAIPALFFLSWNTKDVIIRNFFPKAFYNEGRVLYWTRAVLVGTFNDYLLPAAGYVDAVEFIKKNSKPGDMIFVWGDGAYLYYFSDRRPAISHLWPKGKIFKMMQNYKSGDELKIAKAVKQDKKYIGMVNKNRPVFIIDTSGNGLSLFNLPLTGAPLFYKHIMQEYKYVGRVNSMDFYMRNDLAGKRL